MIAAARAGRTAGGRVPAARYTRTQQLMPEFATALRAADEIVLTDIYPGEKRPIADHE